MKKNTKITIAVVSLVPFLVFLFYLSSYFFEALSYLYHSQDVVMDFLAFLAIDILAIGVYIAIIVMLFKGKKILQIICSVLLITFIPLCFFGTFFSTGFLVVFGYNGCSYTEDITNYGKYDIDIDLSYFPEEITDDMTVVNFSYFYKYADTKQTDVYLEVQFEDKDTMDEYLNIAQDAFSENGVITYTNPYNPEYTDIIENDWVLSSSKDGTFAASIEFDGSETYESLYVDMSYKSITYSYDDLTIIYNYTFLDSDIKIGNNPDKGEYYPKYLERFGVEWSRDNNFKYKLEE